MSQSKAEALARQLEACMTSGKLFTRKMMEQVRDELRRLDAENEPLRRAQEMARKGKAKTGGGRHG